MTRTAVALALVLAAGCRAGGTASAPVDDDQWVTLSPSPWQVRLAKPDPAEGENPTPLAIARAGADTVLATGSRQPGTTIRFTDGGLACELHVDRDYQYDDTTAPVGMKHPKPSDLRTRTYRGIVTTVRCPGRAVPGTDAAARGSRALLFVPWFALALLAGAFAGRLFRGDRIGAGLGAFAAGLAVVLGAGIGAIGGRFALPSILALAGAFVLGAVAGAAEPARRSVPIVAAIAAVAGALALALAVPRWSMLSPIGATLIAAGAMLVVLVVGVLLPDPSPGGSRSRPSPPAARGTPKRSRK